MCRLIGCAILALSACSTQPVQPDAFGITMVEETECNGRGGRITAGPDGSYCADGAGL